MPENIKRKTKKFSVSLQLFILFILIFSGTGYYYFRYIINANLQEVIPGKVYRSAQPSESQLKKWVKKYGIKTVINLRARRLKDCEIEKEICEQEGIQFVPVDLSGNMLITPADLMRLVEAVETSERPVLLHCKSGIDRAGTAAALASFAIGKLDFDTSQRQAYVPPGPWKRKNFSKNRADYVHDYVHISDTLKLYEDYCERSNLDKNYWEQFMLWAIDLHPIEDIDIEYKPVYCYFPFLNTKKHFFPLHKLFKGAYVQFPIQILIIILLIYYTKFCLKIAWNKK